MKSSNEPVIKPYCKSIDTDALKRAVYTLGAFTDVYTQDETPDENEQHRRLLWLIENVFPKAIQNMIDKKYTPEAFATLIINCVSGLVTKKEIENVFRNKQ